jgi:hypothetical protein
MPHIPQYGTLNGAKFSEKKVQKPEYCKSSSNADSIIRVKMNVNSYIPNLKFKL